MQKRAKEKKRGRGRQRKRVKESNRGSDRERETDKESKRICNNRAKDLVE